MAVGAISEDGESGRLDLRRAVAAVVAREASMGEPKEASAPSRRRGVRRAALVLSVATAWVSVAQLARFAEEETTKHQEGSLVPIMTFANAAAWMLLAIPHMLRKARERRAARASSLAAVGGAASRGSFQLLRTDAFRISQPPRFLAIALSTNFCYVAALHFLPASLNTAVFCTGPIFTLLLSFTWLPADVGASSPVRTLRSWRRAVFSAVALSVVLSVAGVVLIAEPWTAVAGSSYMRAVGVSLSVLAALGTATYQIYFKVTFGDSLRPDEVGLFLAHMGALSTCVVGSALAFFLASGVYRLDLALVPWHLVAATAGASALFNFLIKFGLSVDSPVAMSMATQIGIPLNVLLDVVIVHANLDMLQVFGALLMLLSFTLQQRRGKEDAHSDLHGDDDAWRMNTESREKALALVERLLAK